MAGRNLRGVVIGVMLGAVGCTPQQLTPQTPGARLAKSAAPSSVGQAPSPQEKPDNDKSLIAPTPNLLVKAGAVQERMADDAVGNPDRDKIYDLARRSYQHALRIDANYLPAHLALARLYEKLHDSDRALATYREALRVQPKDATIWLEMGMCQARQHDSWEAAVDSLKTAYELDPENRQYAKTLGFCLARAGHYDESLACLKRTVGEAEARCDLARMLHHLHQDAASRQQLQLALQMNPQLEAAQQLQAQLDAPPAAPIASGATVAPSADLAPAIASPRATLSLENIE